MTTDGGTVDEIVDAKSNWPFLIPDPQQEVRTDDLNTGVEQEKAIGGTEVNCGFKLY